jgi:hypothetical protein
VQAMASSLHYLLSFESSEAGKMMRVCVLLLFWYSTPANDLSQKSHRCMDFSSNPYATVLIPEPIDYFAACGATPVCGAKCGAEFTAFDTQLAVKTARAHAHARAQAGRHS